MKKILLGTSGLFGAVALMASAAAAQTPVVTIGGFIDFQAGFTRDGLEEKGTAVQQRETGFRNDSEVSIRVDGKADNGLGYGAVIDLEADVTSDSDNEGVNASRTYIFLDGNWGRFELGSNTGAAEAMKLDASNIARATGGIDGAWGYFANFPTGASFITTPSLPTGHGLLNAAGDESYDNDNKVTYYSPRSNGFQVGFSFTPDLTDRGQTVTRGNANTGGAGEIIDAALSYEGTWDELSVGFAAAGQVGNSETAAVEDIEAWNVGLSAGWSGFRVAGSYGDWGDSLQASGTDAAYWTLGGSYDFGPFGTSVTYMSSSIESGASEDEFDNLSFGADYSLAPGLTTYAEVSLFEFEGAGSGTTEDNEGTSVIFGTQLAF